MDDLTKEDLTEALRAITSLLNKCENVKGNFLQGTSQHTLLNDTGISKSSLAEQKRWVGFESSFRRGVC